MEGILELLDFIGVTNDFYLFLIIRLKHTMSLDYLPDTLFVLGESSVLGWDLAFVLDDNLLYIVLKNIDVVVVKFKLIY